jgi:electron transport complex protein RnfD
LTNRIHLPRKISTAALPHYSGAITTSRAMWTMTAFLSVLGLWSVVLFGFQSLAIIAVSLGAAVLSEAAAVLLIFHANRFAAEFARNISDGSSMLIGMLLGLSLPVSSHPLLPVLAAAFAILVVKWSFGGLGKYWVNPAAAGWLFVHLSWPAGFISGTWGRGLIPAMGWNVDGISAASHLTEVKTLLISNGSGRVFRPLQLVGGGSTGADDFLVRLLNEQLLIPMGTILPDGYMDYLLGFRLGAIGETSIILILLVSVFLFARGIISWEIPASGALTMAILSFFFSGTHWGAAPATGDALYALMSGGFLFALFFLATDPVTTPYTTAGKLLFGFGFGALAFVFREFSILPDGSALALVTMNALTPLIILLSRRRPFGMPRFAARSGGRHE